MKGKKYLALLLAAVFMVLGNSMVDKEEIFASAIVSQQIPGDAVEYNGNYYKVYTDIISTSLKGADAWTTAENYCESLGGHLATISSDEENSFIFSYIDSVGVSSAYFGLSDQEIEGTWKWVNGEDINYTNWASGEPNAESSIEDYTMFYYKFTTGKWNDGNFGGSTVNGGRNFICEWENSEPAVNNTKDITVCIDNKEINYSTPPMYEGDIIMLPIKETFKALGAVVCWDEADRIVTVGKGSAIIRIPINKKTAYRNNEPIELQTEAKIISEISYAPVDFICKALELNYNYIKEDNTIQIESGSKWDNTDLLNPIAYREVRYLPDTDQFYIRVDLNPLAGQKNEKEYPVVWLGVNDNGNWYYSSKKAENLQSMKPNPGSELIHIRYNVYEKYIQADDLPRNIPLEFMIFVDGYNTIPAAELTKADRVITPLPKKAWQVQYNWLTDELEVIAEPIFASETLDHRIYAHIYDSGGKDLYVNHDKNNLIPLDSTSGTNTYYRSWKFSDFFPNKGTTYRIAVVMEGFEPDNSIDYSRLVDVFEPKVDSFSVKYDSKAKKIKVNGIGLGITGKHSVYLKVGTNDKTKLTTFINANKAYSSFSGETGISSLNLSENKKYDFYVVSKDSKGKTVYTSSKLNQTLKNAAGSNSFFLDYASQHKTFDYTKDRKYSFSNLSQALQDTDNNWIAAYNVRENLLDINFREDLVKLLEGEIWLDEYSGYSKDYYKKAILEIISLEDNESSLLLLEEIESNLSVYNDTQGLSADMVKDILDLDIDSAIKYVEENLDSKDAKKVVPWIKSYKTVMKVLSLGDYALKYGIIVTSTYDIKEDMLNAIEIVAKDSGDDLFIKALKEVKNSIKKREGKLVFDDRVTESIDQTMEIALSMVVKKGMKVAVKFVPVLNWLSYFDTALDISLDIVGVDERMDNIYTAIHDGFIQLYANNAYIKFRKNKDIDDIKASGLVYLSAAKFGNQHYGKFLELLKIVTPKKAEGEIDKTMKSCYGKIELINYTLQLWQNDGKVSFSNGGGKGGGGSSSSIF